MKILHEKNILNNEFPFELWVADNIEYCPHWHQGIEVVYVTEGSTKVGLNNKVYTLNHKDILVISGGDVHYFCTQNKIGKMIIFQFELSVFDIHAASINNRKFINPLIRYKGEKVKYTNVDIHHELEKYILTLLNEYNKKLEGYQMILKARLYDLMVTLIRYLPTKQYSSMEKTKQLIRLERLEKVFLYVEKNHSKTITIEDISKIANYSPYHFTRFFKNITGMTFGQYLSSFRIKKSEQYLLNDEHSITEIVYMCGFNSVKTFNRIFKKTKGCSPTEYRKKQYLRTD